MFVVKMAAAGGGRRTGIASALAISVSVLEQLYGGRSFTLRPDYKSLSLFISLSQYIGVFAR